MATRGFPNRKLKDAKDWLHLELSDGKAHAAGELIAHAETVGIAPRTLQRASLALNVQKTPANRLASGKVETWLWSLSTARRKPGPKSLAR